MADDATLTNQQTSFTGNTNPDINVRARETASGKKIQAVYLDLGSGSAEDAAVNSIPVRGEVSDAAVGWTNPVVIAYKDVFTGAARVPVVFQNLGIDFPLSTPVDPNLAFPNFRAGTGEAYSLGASTDDTKANAHYFLIDSARKIITRSYCDTGGTSSVSGSATSVTLLASNTARLGATITNDSTAILYVKFGATASTTSYTVKMQPDQYFEVPFGYRGIIDGIWASAAGAARITELT